jgi:hypothetical protein
LYWPSGLAAFTFVRLFSNPSTPIFWSVCACVSSPLCLTSLSAGPFLHRRLPGSSLPCRFPYATSLRWSSCLLRHPVVSDLAVPLAQARASIPTLSVLSPPPHLSLVLPLASSLSSPAWVIDRLCSVLGQSCFHSGAGCLSVSARLSTPLGRPTHSSLWCVPLRLSCSLGYPAAGVCHALIC